MGKSSDETLKESSKVIVSNILYQYEYREVLVTLLRNFQEVFQTRSMLRDLVETTHLYVQMLEVHCQQNSCVMTQERRKKSTGKKKGRRGMFVCLDVYEVGEAGELEHNTLENAAHFSSLCVVKGFQMQKQKHSTRTS